MNKLRLKKILVPVDFSVPALKAVKYAVSFARDYDAQLILLHVVDMPRAAEPSPRATASPSHPSLTRAQKQLNELTRREVPEDVAVVSLTRSGDPLTEILQTARLLKADLLLVSTHARAGLPDFCLGSAAE